MRLLHGTRGHNGGFWICALICAPRHWFAGSTNRRGFTLVELLVTISIIGILVALLVPAVQHARESGRRTHCANNLKQIGLAFLLHEQTNRHLPTGGWGWRWHGDPDRGYGKHQPGGWIYNILPYIEQASLHERGAGQSDLIKRAEGKAVAETSLPTFHCPSRRSGLQPFVHVDNFFNIDRPLFVATTDYVGNVGDLKPLLYGPGPASLLQGDDKTYAWTQLDRTGVVYRRSEVALRDILDGASNTYLAGEGYVDPRDYETGKAGNSNQGMYVGYDRDTLRVTHPQHPPWQDEPGANHDHSFGSPHSAGFHVVLGDSSVRIVRFEVSLEVHRRLGNRSDGKPVDLTAL